jgi:hypothetical protein
MTPTPGQEFEYGYIQTQSSLGRAARGCAGFIEKLPFQLAWRLIIKARCGTRWFLLLKAQRSGKWWGTVCLSLNNLLV